MDNIFIHSNGRQQGPYTLADVRKMASEGSLHPTDYIWFQGCQDWIPLRSVDELWRVANFQTMANVASVQQERRSAYHVPTARENRSKESTLGASGAGRSSRKPLTTQPIVAKSTINPLERNFIEEKKSAYPEENYFPVDKKKSPSSEIIPKANIEAVEDKKMLAGQCVGQMIIGGLFAIGGTIATVIGYNMAASNPGGGTYLIFWGAIVFGIYDFFRGLFGWLKCLVV